MRFANQDSIIVKKGEDFTNPKEISIYHLKAQSIAANLLSKNAYLLWEYLNRNQNEFRLELSFVAFTNIFHMSDKSYRRAKQELIEAKYMVQIKPSVYNFYEYPCEEEGVQEPAKVVETPMRGRPPIIVDDLTFKQICDDYEDLGDGTIRLTNGNIVQKQLSAQDF